MMYKAFLILLPAVAYAQISIRVEAGSNVDHAVVLGEDVAMISDTERRTWQIYSDQQLKDMVETCSGNRPDAVYVKMPLPYNETYKEGWKNEVHRILRPNSARILGFRQETITVARQEYVNNNTDTVTYIPSITHSVLENISTTWVSDGELTINQDISYSFLLPKLNHSIPFTGAWGKETAGSKRFTVELSESGVAVRLKPGEASLAILIATRGSMEVQVNYTAILDGYIACNYEARKRIPSHIVHTDINGCLIKAKKRTAVNSNVVFKIQFEADPKIAVYKRFPKVPTTEYIFKVYS